MLASSPTCIQRHAGRASRGRRVEALRDARRDPRTKAGEVMRVVCVRVGGVASIYLVLAHLALAGAGRLARTRALPAAGVGLGALAVDRQAARMPQAAVGADLLEALDVLGALPAQIALDSQIAVDPLAQLADLVVGEVLDVGVWAHAGLLEHLARGRAPDPVDVGEADLDALIQRDVDSCDACHVSPAAACDAGSGRSRGPRHDGGRSCTSRTWA